MSHQDKPTLPTKRRLDLDSVESLCAAPATNGDELKKPSGSVPLLTRTSSLECDEIYEPVMAKKLKAETETKRSLGHAALARYMRSDLSASAFKATLTEEERDAMDFIIDPVKPLLAATDFAKASPVKTRIPLAVTTTSNCFTGVFDNPASPLVPSLLLQTPQRKVEAGSDRAHPIAIDNSPIVRRPSPRRCSSPEFPETMHCRETYSRHVDNSPKSPEYDPISPKAYPASPDFVPPSPSYNDKPGNASGNKCFAPVEVVPETPREHQESPSSDETVHVDFGRVIEPPKVRCKPKLTVIIPVFKGEPLRLVTPIKAIVPTFKGEAPRLLPVKSIKPFFREEFQPLSESNKPVMMSSRAMSVRTVSIYIPDRYGKRSDSDANDPNPATPANARRSSRWAGGAPRKPKRFLQED